MKRFKNILLVADQEGFHDALIGRAIWLAKANGARLTLVDVVSATPKELSSILAGLPNWQARDLQHKLLQSHRARLDEIAAPVRAEGIETRQLVLQGVPFIEIIKQVLNARHDLVMKGAHDRRRVRRSFFGSVDLHLLRKCPCPVWLMKRTRRRHYARVLAAVDPDPTTPRKDPLNRLILDLATSLSAIDQSELHVVHAWSVDGESTIRNSPLIRTSEREIDHLVERERDCRSMRLNQLLQHYPLGSPERQVHLLKGRARSVIPELAREKRVELIVMGTIARTGIPGLIIGNTAEAILEQVDCSILAVKPPDFEPPVEPRGISAMASPEVSPA